MLSGVSLPKENKEGEMCFQLAKSWRRSVRVGLGKWFLVYIIVAVISWQTSEHFH